MKFAAPLARCLLGLVFLVFGLNGFLHFIPMPPMTGLPAQFMMALGMSGFLVVVFLLQIIPAVLLLLNRYVPLALVLLGPVLVNIILFHIFMAPAGLPLPIILLVCFAVVASVHWRAFSEIFRARPPAVDGHFAR